MYTYILCRCAQKRGIKGPFSPLRRGGTTPLCGMEVDKKQWWRGTGALDTSAVGSEGEGWSDGGGGVLDGG